MFIDFESHLGRAMAKEIRQGSQLVIMYASHMLWIIEKADGIFSIKLPKNISLNLSACFCVNLLN